MSTIESKVHQPLLTTGDTAQWSSQSGGFHSTKAGEVVAIVQPGEDPVAIFNRLFPDASKSSRKFDGGFNVNMQPRYMVAVPRGGKSDAMDYYCPFASNVDRQMTKTAAPVKKRGGFTLTEVLVALTICLVLVSIPFQCSLALNHTRIVVPGTWGHKAQTYYVDSYREHDGCVEFNTWFGGHRKVCGNYIIKSPGEF